MKVAISRPWPDKNKRINNKNNMWNRYRELLSNTFLHKK